MKRFLLLFSLSITQAFAANNLPAEAMMNLAGFRGNYRPSNCVETNVKNGVLQKGFACNADLVQINYSHMSGVLQNYFFTNSNIASTDLVYGRMVFVGQLGCRSMESLDSTECFNIKSGYFAENVDYKFEMVCGEKTVINSTKLHWEFKKVGTGVDMLVHEDIFYNVCTEEETLDTPFVMTKDLTVRLELIK